MLFVVVCWKRRYALCNPSETNPNNIYQHRFHILIVNLNSSTIMQRFQKKHIEARCASASDNMWYRINKIDHGSMLYLRSN
jgi:hypothetical protein